VAPLLTTLKGTGPEAGAGGICPRAATEALRPALVAALALHIVRTHQNRHPLQHDRAAEDCASLPQESDVRPTQGATVLQALATLPCSEGYDPAPVQIGKGQINAGEAGLETTRPSLRRLHRLVLDHAGSEN